MIILTGASGGIGRQVIKHLVKIDNVMGIYNKTRPKAISGPGYVYKKLDLSDAVQVKRFVKENEGKLKKVTLLNLAAQKKDGLVAGYSESDWDNMLSVNLKGSFLLIKALLPHMIAERWGRIINVSSLGGIQGKVGTASYSTVKMGLIGFSKVLAKEYARFNITTNVLILGYFKSGLFNGLSNDYKKELINRIPSGALGEVSNIANAVEFLIKSEYVNGAAINIDGGAE